MKTTLHLKSTITPAVRGSIRCPPLRRVFLFVPLLLTVVALSPTVKAVTPAPDGGYPQQNTAEGTDALFSLTTGADNTANGFDSLLQNTTGNDNTAIGSGALGANITGSNNQARPCRSRDPNSA